MTITILSPHIFYEMIWSLIGLFLSLGRFYLEGVSTGSLAFAGSHWLATILKAIWNPMEFLGSPRKTYEKPLNRQYDLVVTHFENSVTRADCS